MLPASNRGAGQNLCFPDVCLTPAPPAPPIPVPYPNIALNAQAQGFAPNVKISGMNALNLGSKISMTSGDEAGAAHLTIKGMGGYAMGNPIVSINKMPAINLTCQANGNMMNAPMGAVLVPSAVNVTYCDARPRRLADIDGPALAALGEAVRPPTGGDVEAELLADRVALLRVARITSDAHVELANALREHVALGARAFLLDLRGNGGGDLRAALGCASTLLPEGSILAIRIDRDGDETVIRARSSQAWRGPLAVLVDRGTASAAEVLAGALRANVRAVVVGEPSYGKGTAQAVAMGGATMYGTVAELRLPNGEPIEGLGLTPDVVCEAGQAVRVAVDLLRGAIVEDT